MEENQSTPKIETLQRGTLGVGEGFLEEVTLESCPKNRSLAS